MSGYKGWATLTIPDDTEHQVYVNISTRVAHHDPETDETIRQWIGYTTVDSRLPILNGDSATLRLPDGGEGRCRLVWSSGPYSVNLDIEGIGRPPFDAP